MKRIVGIIAVVLAIIGLVSFGARSFGNEKKSQQTEIGRFQLFQGTYWIRTGGKTGSKDDAIFLLDTSTGEVEFYVVDISEDGRTIRTWLNTEHK